MQGNAVERFVQANNGKDLPRYASVHATHHVLMKVETHNHPTAISPFPGASTGNGGEIRDEGATGRGSKPKAGLTGFTVSKLWETEGNKVWQALAYGKCLANHDRRAFGRLRHSTMNLAVLIY
jgi:phosphoribosylformylglycinamidine synthase